MQRLCIRRPDVLPEWHRDYQRGRQGRSVQCTMTKMNMAAGAIIAGIFVIGRVLMMQLVGVVTNVGMRKIWRVGCRLEARHEQSEHDENG